ncbi:MAG: lipoprotein NlpI [Bacteroidetes bacterium ADurb.Bin408]|nr:MAG: lipoprotein NlpI [Bacteroidetes bacterium ADurb.Bin408]
MKNAGKKKNKRQPAIPKKKSNGSVNPLWWLALIIVLTLVAYSNSFKNEFLNFDDNEYFSNYPEILHFNASAVIQYFSNYYVLMYQPLPILTFALTYKFFGLSPLPYHALNLFFHLCNILLVYIFVKRLTFKNSIALISSLFFAVHPMNVEAVSWISARSSSMFVFFYLLALLFYLRYSTESYKPRFLILALLFFLLSLFSKAHAVTLPLILVVIDIFRKRKWDKRMIFEKIPFFVMSILFGLIAIAEKGTTTNILLGLEKFTFFDNFFLLTYSVSFYIVRLFLPFNLCAVYVYPEKAGGWLPFEYYLSPLLLIIIIWAVIRYRKTKPYLLFGVLFFIAALSLTLQIIPSRLFIVTDRYTYLPYLGLFIIIGYLFEEIKKKKVQNALTLLIVVMGLFFTFLTYSRNKNWANDMTLGTDIINKNPEVPYIARAFGVRGNYYLNRLKDFDKAMKDYNTALTLDTTDAISYYNRGYLNDKLGNYKGVINDMTKAGQLGIDNYLVNSFLGAAYFREKDIPKAIENFEISIKKNPDYIENYNNLGAIYSNMQRPDLSSPYIDKALALDSNNTEALRNKGIIYFELKNFPEACRFWKKARDLGAANVGDLLKAYCGE